MEHITVLREEAVAALALTPSSTVVDATVGSAGHTADILAALGPSGTYVGIDVDAQALAAAQPLVERAPAATHLVCANFAELDHVLSDLDLATVDAILADLGWRIEQFEGGGRGLSFRADEPLLMTFGDPARYAMTAADIVNDWAEADLANVLYGYGEERYARRIARAIVEARQQAPIATAAQLATIIERAVPAAYRRGRTHAATKSFQALRIAVNDEFAVLETLIDTAFKRLAPGGRLAIISFHSLEDRIVKHRFRALAAEHGATLMTKKPIEAGEEERRANPRARSAKLRVLERPHHDHDDTLHTITH